MEWHNLDLLSRVALEYIRSIHASYSVVDAVLFQEIYRVRLYFIFSYVFL